MSCLSWQGTILRLRQFYLQLEVSRAMLARKKSTIADARVGYHAKASRKQEDSDEFACVSSSHWVRGDFVAFP
jgi:hypothetical protein